MKRRRQCERVDHAAAALRLRALPGQWVPVGRYRSRPTAESVSYKIRNGQGAYAPTGAFLARVVLVDDEALVEGRFVAAAPGPLAQTARTSPFLYTARRDGR